MVAAGANEGDKDVEGSLTTAAISLDPEPRKRSDIVSEPSLYDASQAPSGETEKQDIGEGLSTSTECFASARFCVGWREKGVTRCSLESVVKKRE